MMFAHNDSIAGTERARSRFFLFRQRDRRIRIPGVDVALGILTFLIPLIFILRFDAAVENTGAMSVRSWDPSSHTGTDIHLLYSEFMLLLNANGTVQFAQNDNIIAIFDIHNVRQLGIILRRNLPVDAIGRRFLFNLQIHPAASYENVIKLIDGLHTFNFTLTPYNATKMGLIDQVQPIVMWIDNSKASYGCCIPLRDPFFHERPMIIPNILEDMEFTAACAEWTFNEVFNVQTQSSE